MKLIKVRREKNIQSKRRIFDYDIDNNINIIEDINIIKVYIYKLKIK